MHHKKIHKTTLTPEQFKFVKANRKMTVPAMAKHLNISPGTLSYNRWVIKESEKPIVPKDIFDVETYFKELVTI